MPARETGQPEVAADECHASGGHAIALDVHATGALVVHEVVMRSRPGGNHGVLRRIDREDPSALLRPDLPGCEADGRKVAVLDLGDADGRADGIGGDVDGGHSSLAVAGTDGCAIEHPERSGAIGDPDHLLAHVDRVEDGTGAGVDLGDRCVRAIGDPEVHPIGDDPVRSIADSDRGRIRGRGWRSGGGERGTEANGLEAGEQKRHARCSSQSGETAKGAPGGQDRIEHAGSFVCGF